jgi:nudix-type nucleoside diphosphatase (YffH/AdpP family)
MAMRILGSSILYQGWMKVLRVKLEIDTREIEREVEDHGRAVAFLPYDPERRVVLIARQVRVPVFLADRRPDLLEAGAGMVDSEEPEAAARREASEELGVNLRTLEHVGGAWTTPGISTEFMDLYLAPYSLADRMGPGGGLAGEQEQISVVEMPIAELWRMIERRELADLKTLALVLFLRARHPHLFPADAC